VKNPDEFIDEYLQLCEDLQLDAANELLDPELIMVFPGGRTYRSLAQMLEASKNDYKWVKKNRIHSSSWTDGEETLVTARGTLFGETMDGVPFEGIRYVDFFIIRNNKIIEQHVWNDLADRGVIEPTPLKRP
jgi:hypothetical protein